MKKTIREVLIYVAIGAVLYFALQFTMQNYTVIYTSMTPSVQQGDWIRVSKVQYWIGPPSRGDVIVFWPPEDPGATTPYIKRVIGLPGDTVEIRNDEVRVNGHLLNEPYIMAEPTYTVPLMTVPAGQYFVLGDNRNNSTDSHIGWTVPRENIIGKAWFIYWPPSRWGLVTTYDLGANK